MALVNRRSPRQSPPRPVKSTISEVEELARQVADLQRAKNPFAYGTELDFNIVAANPPNQLSGSQVLQHKLGRIPEGYIVLDFVSPIVSEALCRLAWDARTITLWSNRECYGRVLVY